MDPQTQRERHTAVTKLREEVDTALDDLHTLVTGEWEIEMEKLRADVSDVEVELDAVKTGLQDGIDAHSAILGRRFWGRMKWLVTGK